MRRTAVVVDDEPITRMDLADLLARAGFEVAAQGADGFDAVEICRVHTPTLVLLDIKMPVFNGLDAAKTILAEKLADAVVLLTAYSDADFVARAAQMGVGGYLVKPIDERMLVPVVEIALAQSGRLQKAEAATEKLRQKMEGRNYIERARAAIAKEEGISESEAHAKLQKLAMDKRTTPEEMARQLIGQKSDKPLLDEAKQALMDRYSLSEKAAYKRLHGYATANGLELPKAAAKLLEELGER